MGNQDDKIINGLKTNERSGSRRTLSKLRCGKPLMAAGYFHSDMGVL